MDVVYILGTGSRWANNELRYSLRSLQKHAQNLGTIWVVGEKPDWINWSASIKHLAYTESSSKSVHIWEKLRRAALHPDVSEYFIYFDDDHFLMRTTDLAQLPHYHSGDLYPLNMGFLPGTGLDMWQTLNSEGFSSNNFDIHVPFPITKSKFLQVWNKWGHTRHGINPFLPRSLYGNMFQIPGVFLPDLKIGRTVSTYHIEQLIGNRFCFSISDGALQDHFKSWLHSKFPNPSSFEL